MKRVVVTYLALLALVGADECSDGGRCIDGQTCCNDPANGSECCPFAEAECCEDHVHCCPVGTTCHKATSSCVNGTTSIPWVESNSADQPRLSKSFRMIKTNMGEEDDNICPDQSRCPPEFSCLKALTRFGCCPLAQGVSCSDGKHCCPDGHQCSADSRSCIKKELVTTILCGDKASECPEETTCCENSVGTWGCCPMPMAVCCEDKIHCCSEGSVCETEHSKCISLSTKKELPMWAKLPARIRADWEIQKEVEQVKAETVDDGGSEKVPEVTTIVNTLFSTGAVHEELRKVQSEEENKEVVGMVQCDVHYNCPQNNTCCFINSSQTWSCCPVLEALCCSDGVHCCPNGYQCCDGTCTKGDKVIPWYNKLPAITSIQTSTTTLQCDAMSQCPDGNTCCKLVTGEFGCCPLPNALCCSDGVHCCPHGYQCHNGSCTKGDEVIPWYTKLPANASIQTNPTTVQCDAMSQCPDGNTCCKLVTGEWACCPLPKALCCSDAVHCCPNGYQCHDGTCTKGDKVIPWYNKLPAITSIQTSTTTVHCADGSQCPDGNTCCKLVTGEFGCCPLPNALCCSDGVHCCPHGYQCHNGSCTKGDEVIPWYTKLPANASIQTNPTAVQCDAMSQCPDGNTCCKLVTGEWACCPLPKALCCSDGVHCCPNGYQCHDGTCTKGDKVIPWYNKLPAITSIQTSTTTVHCADGSQCPDGNTCCKLVTGEFGCCPLPNALCCSDGVHCCPHGYQCHNGSCTKGDEVIPWYTKLPANASIQTNPTTVQCDAMSQCPDGNTCCKLVTGEWACCPLPKALCCSDGVHCCPNGYQCHDGTCTKGDKVIPWYNKLPAITSIQTSTTTVHCADGSQCPDGNTCCKLVTGEFGCCPLPNALCCSDGVHCCPHGYQCHNGSCTKGDEVIPWYTKLPANASIQTNPTTVQCDAMSQCPDGNTCCKLVTGEWACCPLPKALCCSDAVHCCPNGYQCHDGTCTKGDKVIPWYNKLPAITSIQTSTTTVHCADGSQCPDGNTCCKLVTGEFGCCPLPNAVCCRDRQHCCPQGYTCNVTSNSCQRHIMLQLNAFPLMPVDLPEIQLQLRETQCDENTKCIEGDTCCLISTTAWGCCPYPDAVCCSDMKHCCPANYICAEGRECKKKRLWFNWHMHITSKKTSVIL